MNLGNKKAKLQVVNNEQKTVTANPVWTAEDHLRLKELIAEFPTEEEEALRWEKIASCLGNHTHFEVYLISTFILLIKQYLNYFKI